MDNGLRRVQGRKVPVEILDVDLQDLARGLTSVMRGQASSQVIRIAGVPYVQLNGRGVNVTIPRAAWLRILPLVADGTLSTQVVPVESAVRPLDATRFSSSTVDSRDPLYRRVYGTLGLLFTNKVPI